MPTERSLAEHVNVGFMLIGGGIVISALSDAFFLGNLNRQVHVIQAFQLGGVLGLAALCRRRPAWAAWIGIAGLSLVCLSTAATSVATDDDTTSSLLLIALVTASGTLLPWRARWQAALAVVALLSIAGNVLWLDGVSGLAPRYPLLVSAVMIFTASVYIARRLARLRVAAARAEMALSRAHAELERRVEERTAQVHRANLALQGEMVHRRRLEEEARQHQAELAHATRLASMGQMAAEVAHELNQPLAAIACFAQGSSRRLRTGSTETPELLASLESITEQALRAGDVLRSMTAFARNRAVEHVVRDLGEVIADACRFLEPECARSGATVQLELSPSPLLVVIDPLQVEQVIVNLVCNSLDAMKEMSRGERRVRVRVAPVEAGLVRVAVHDNGAGIPPETRARMFEPFFTTKKEGLGLGLSVSRSIVESHSGRLWVASEGERGTTLCFTLPFADACSSAAPECS